MLCEHWLEPNARPRTRAGSGASTRLNGDTAGEPLGESFDGGAVNHFA